MSKRNREKRSEKVLTPQGLISIQQTLRTDLGCTEKEIELVQEALAHRAPQHVVDHIIAIHEGKVPLPIKRPSLHLEMEDGKVQ